MRDNKKVVRNPIPNHRNLEVLQSKATIMETSPIDRFLKRKDYSQTPYKGLNPYDEEDASIFFGRESDIQEVVNNLLAWRLTILYGKSGVGKSSILRAGVTHILNEEAQQNRIDYDGLPKLAIVVFPSLEGKLSWKDDPLLRLMQQIEATIAQNDWDISHPEPGLSFIDTLRHWTDALGGDNRDGELYIILDQFEEYFLYHENEQAEGTFYTEFPRAVNCPDLRVNFLISTREDSLASLDRFQSVIPDLFDHRVQIGHLSGRAAADAIQKPIDYYNQHHSKSIGIEQSLVNAILDEVQVGKVVLGENGLGGLKIKKERLEMQIEAPYLQLVMERLWKKERDQKSDVLRLSTFKALGKADQIVKEHLNRQLKGLTGKQPRVAVGIFQHLVTASGIKYAYSITDLADDTGYDKSLVKEVLESLSEGDQRILRPVGPAKPDQPDTQRYEIFHDALAPAILDWRRGYLAQKQRKQMTKRLGISALGAALGIGIIALASTHYRTKVDLLAVEATQPLQQFEAGQQLEALQQAIQIGWQVQNRVQNSPFNILLGHQKEQAISQATLTLQNILSKIQEQNQFSISSGQVERLAFNPDWTIAATVLGDNTVQVLDLKTGIPLESFEASAAVNDISFSPDSQTLVMGATDGSVWKWDWQTSKPLTLPKLSAKAPTNLRFSLQNETLAGAIVEDDNYTVQAWNWATDEPLGKPVSPSHTLSSFNLSPNGQLLAAISKGEEGTTLQVWNLQTGNKLATLESPDILWDLDFSCDGRALATAAKNGTVQVWDWQTGNELASFEPTALLWDLDFSCDGKSLVTAAEDGTVQVRDWQTENELANFSLTGQVLRLWLSPDSQKLATASDTGTLSLWELETSQFKQSSEVASLTFSPNGELIATTSWDDNQAYLWDTQGNLQTTLEGLDIIVFSPNSELIATTSWDDNQAYLWDTQGNLKSTLKGNDTITFSPDGELVVTTSREDNQTYLWGTQGNLQTTLEGLDIIVFSPNGELIATTSWDDNQAYLWDTQGNLKSTLKGNDTIVFSPNGELIATTSWDDNQAYLWDTQSDLQTTLEGGGSIIFSPDGQLVATASWNDNQVYLWDTQGDSKIPLEGGESIAFSPDGQLVATTSRADNTVRLWDTQGNLQTTLENVASFVFSPDSQQIVIVSANGAVRILPSGEVDDLGELLKQGCQWLHPYFESHPDERKGVPCSSIIVQ